MNETHTERPAIVGRPDLAPVAQRSPLEGLSAQVGAHAERIHRLGEQLLAEFGRYDTARGKLLDSHNATVEFDFGGPVNSALANWRQQQKPAGTA